MWVVINLRIDQLDKMGHKFRNNVNDTYFYVSFIWSFTWLANRCHNKSGHEICNLIDSWYEVLPMHLEVKDFNIWCPKLSEKVCNGIVLTTNELEKINAGFIHVLNTIKEAVSSTDLTCVYFSDCLM